MSKKLVILFTVFIDILGLGIIIPVLPFYVQSFGASEFTVTLLFSVFSVFAFFSAPMLGAISDRVGRRPVLIFSILSTAIGWLVFAGAKNIFFLFLGRIIDGAAAGNLPTAQNYLVDISKDAKERTTNLGLIGAMFGIGLTVGPMIGGLLASVSHRLPFWTVGIMALVNVVLAYFFLPEVYTKKNELIKISYNPFRPIIRSLSQKELLPSFIAWFLFGLAVASYQSIFALYLDKGFGYKEIIVGIFLTGSGIGIAVNQGFLLKNFWLRKFKESDLELNMFIILGIAFLLMSWPNIYVLIIGLIFFTISQSLIRPITTSLVAGASGASAGENLGMLFSLFNLSAIIGPVIAGASFILKPFFWPFVIAAFFSFAGHLVLLNNRNKLQKAKDIPREEMDVICQ